MIQETKEIEKFRMLISDNFINKETLHNGKTIFNTKFFHLK